MSTASTGHSATILREMWIRTNQRQLPESCGMCRRQKRKLGLNSLTQPFLQIEL